MRLVEHPDSNRANRADYKKLPLRAALRPSMCIYIDGLMYYKAN